MSPVTFHTAFGFLFSFLCLAGIGVLFWIALRRPPTRQPSCGHCGYAVEGLEALSCPECGSDLRKVGIETPKRKMLHPGLFVLFWSLLLIIPFATAYSQATRMGPRIFTAHATFGLTSSSGSLPPLHIDQRMQAAGAGQSVFVSSASVATVVRDETTTSDILFPAVSGVTMHERIVEVRTAADAVQLIPPKVTLQSGDGDAGAVDLATLRLVLGEVVESPEDGAEVVALLNALMAGDKTFTTNRLGLSGRNTVTSVSKMAPWYVPTLAAVAAIIYGLGILVYALLRRKRLER